MKKYPSRKKIVSELDRVIRYSKYGPVVEVDVQSKTSPSGLYSESMKTFNGSNLKSDLLFFLMDKSLTYRILNIHWWRYTLSDFSQAINLQMVLLGSEDKFLEYTNIDSDMLELIGKVRFVDEDI